MPAPRTRLAAIALAATPAVAITGTASGETRYATASRIVHAVFPAATANAALRVVACETGGTYNPLAYNPGSGATGYFQILQANAGRHLRHNGHSYTVPGGRALYDPWLNTRAAYYLSHGGTDWHEWACQP